jgi:hypothetical protein
MLYLLLIVACTLLGAVTLWFSGYFFMRTGNKAPQAPIAPDTSLAMRIAELETAAEKLKQERDDAEIAARRAVEDKVGADEEVARMAVELGQLENQLINCHNDIDRLKSEIDTSQNRPKLNLPPLPSPNNTSSHINDEFDALAIQLDLEKVAHQKTREELENLKKSAATPHPPERRAFPTMAFAAPRLSLTGAPDDTVTQKSIEKLQAEKDELEAELLKAKQEIQFLKMRST